MSMLQMTWQPSLLKSLKRKHGAPPLGLRNLGNTCYLNSVLQCLTYTPPLANFCLRFLHSSICDLGVGKDKKGDCPFCILEKRITRSLGSEAASDAPVKINSCLRIYAQHFRSGRQEDAHEFLRYVIDACHNTCLRLKKLQLQQRGKGGIVNGGDDSGTGETIVKDIFGGALQSQVKCLSCGAESNKVDEIMDISLDILHSGSLKEALQKFFQPEILDGNNKYKCENCKKLVTAKKQMSILQAPNVLVVQLKRFEGIFGGKIDKAIAFDETLILSNHMAKGSQDQHPEYNLFGTIVHSGFSPDSGHYYAYIKDTIGRWHCCNDSYVSLSTLQEVLSEKVYILFFSRTKQRPKVGLVANGSNSHESNGSKMSPGNKSGCREKLIQTAQVSDHQPEPNISTNGSRPCIRKSGSLAKPFHMKISASHSKINGSNNDLSSNGNKNQPVHTSESVEPGSEKKSSHNPMETANSAVLVESNCTQLNGAQSSGTSSESKDIKESPNHHRQMGNTAIFKVDEGNFSETAINKELLIPGSSKLVAYRNGSVEENGDPGHSVTFTGEEKTGSLSIKRNEAGEVLADAPNTKGKLCSLGSCNGEKGNVSENGPIAVDSSERSLYDVNKPNIKSAAHVSNNRNVDTMDSSKNSSTKRKIEGGHSCIFLARDDKSRAEVEAFKEVIVKEASMALRSCGWSNDVYNFMHTRKKLCQKAGNAPLNDNEKKSLLIDPAKRNFISKIPENLKAILVERLRVFSQQKQSPGN
ncbi:ubiquitin carboxyl-terminal hydrolase 25 [Andrographis paniculata]|uniref:ubiquitin carboxyl-terminal hydrolase 25 n=1 Tax=Andrographis paniculata TaxID=175694 RepID=UPI0021E90633|nr:ubiquitin carboxyl-terminal hydrolase 25 [Andrographis paniculata]XP_051125606.1 ubiquitin carboxyl-terminal hydrolase 25 [Andrographis paniculata]